MAVQQTLLGGGFAGVPQNQTGGVNNAFQPDGTNSSGGTITPATPANWMTVAPQAGIGDIYFITFTDTGLGSGAALIISNNNVQFDMTVARFPVPSGGIGSRNFSYVIKNSVGTTVANGTGNTNNSI